MSLTVVYILVGVVGVFYVLPKIAWSIADAIHRYIHGANEVRGQQRKIQQINTRNT